VPKKCFFILEPEELKWQSCPICFVISDDALSIKESTGYEKRRFSLSIFSAQ
jgi:hypothetical protein